LTFDESINYWTIIGIAISIPAEPASRKQRIRLDISGGHSQAPAENRGKRIGGKQSQVFPATVFRKKGANNKHLS
jgi:hypothetical protein